MSNRFNTLYKTIYEDIPLYLIDKKQKRLNLLETCLHITGTYEKTIFDDKEGLPVFMVPACLYILKHPFFLFSFFCYFLAFSGNSIKTIKKYLYIYIYRIKIISPVVFWTNDELWFSVIAKINSILFKNPKNSSQKKIKTNSFHLQRYVKIFSRSHNKF